MENRILKKLLKGNEKYLEAKNNHLGDISKEIREATHHNGQKPEACIICCSDSRVIPEKIFMVGIGSLFVIRIAGNVLDNYGLGSVEYAIHHLHTKLIMVLGHTKCGAVTSAIHKETGEYVSYILKEIEEAIDGEEDITKAAIKSVSHTVDKVSKLLPKDDEEYQVVGAIYHTLSGKVEIL